MDGTPVGELARNARINTAALRSGNLNTAADVRRHTVRDLEGIRGIGNTSAQKLKELADDLVLQP
jgi:hypothetical protein